MRFKFYFTILIITFTFSTFGYDVEIKDKTIEEIIKLRTKNMSAINSLTKKIYNNLSSKEFKIINENLIGLKHNTMEFKELFPKGSIGGKARKEIWEDKKLFNEYINIFVEDIDQMIKDIDTQDSISLNNNFNIMTSNCGVCHKKFKSK